MNKTFSSLTISRRVLSISYLALGLLFTGCGESRYLPNEGYRALDQNIIGGSPVKASDSLRRSIVGIQLIDPQSGVAGTCTGSIIDKDIVLTAAHCLAEEGLEIRIVFGNDIRKVNSSPLTTLSTLPHEDYKAHSEDSKQTHDLGLIHFEGTLPAGFAPAKMLSSKAVFSEQQEVILAGYGVNNGVTSTGSGILRQVRVAILDPLFSPTEVAIDQTGGKGACNGDSGGPAYVESAGKLLLWGITSRGANGCGQNSIYTNAARYSSWISKNKAAMRRADSAL